MRELRILATAVGGDLSQSVIKCLRASGYSLYIAGCDMNPYAGGRGDVDKFYLAPAVREERRYIHFLQTVIKREQIDYLFPLSEVEIQFLNHQRHIVTGAGAGVVMNDPMIIDTFMDKYQTVQFLNQKGIAVPRTFTPDEYQGQLKFPLILKKRTGSGSSGLYIIHDHDAFDFYLQRNKGMIIQEYLPGDDNEYTAGIFSYHGRIHTIVFKRKLAPGGFSGEAVLVNDPKLTEFAENVGMALDFTGSVNVQFRLRDGECVPFEINPRFSSTVYLRHAFGFKDVQWSLEILEEHPILYKPKYKKGVAVRKFSEVFFDLE